MHLGQESNRTRACCSPMGGAVAGRKVIADWPGLEKLEDNRDLLATTCTRALFKGILLDHLKIDPKILEADIFPESAAVRPMRGLVRVS